MHPTIKKARDLLERLDQQEAEHQTWRAQHAAELEDAEIAALCAAAKPAAIKQRSFNGDLVYKERHSALVQRESFMDPEQQVAWDAWCDGRIGAAAETIARSIGESVGEIEREIRRDYDARLNEQSAIISALRVELAARKRKKP